MFQVIPFLVDKHTKQYVDINPEPLQGQASRSYELRSQSKVQVSEIVSKYAQMLIEIHLLNSSAKRRGSTTPHPVLK